MKMEKTIFIECARLLEEWGMMIVEPADSSISQFNPESPFYVSTIKFKGAVNGEYQILAQKDFAESLVSNLLGESIEEDDDTSAADALREMANVLSGNLLTTCYGKDTVFELTSPEVHSISLDQAKQFFKKPIFCYRGDESPVAISFSLDADV